MGTYTWHASYGGDTLNNGASDQSGTAEQATTVKASPSINTTASVSAGGVVGTAVLSDSVTVSGGDNPTGTVTFILAEPNGTTITVGSVSISGDGTYAAPTVAATQVGTYTWHASYGGDTLNNGASDQGGTAEQATTVKASPSINTTASVSAGGVVGTAVLSDSVTVSGGDNPTGTVTFILAEPNGTTITVGSVSISGDGMYAAPTVAATQVGTYTWHASYGGDTLNNGASDQGGTAEQATTVAASPSINTQASVSAGGVVGTAVLSDSVTVSGGDNPTGTVTFILAEPNGTTITVGSVSISGDGTYAAPTVAATQVGTYTWHASYGGDTLNNGASDQGGTAEQATTVKASPSINTTASVSAGGVVGTAVLSDSVTVSGGDNPTGTVTFILAEPNGTTITVGSVSISGDGTYAAPTVAATQVGTYTWHASYGGDTLNNGASDQGGTAEQATTVKASPSINTRPAFRRAGWWARPY